MENKWDKEKVRFMLQYLHFQTVTLAYVSLYRRKVLKHKIV